MCIPRLLFLGSISKTLMAEEHEYLEKRALGNG
jgi:hypothetical protein